MKILADTKIIRKLSHLKSIYIFNYGGPLMVIRINNNCVRIITSLSGRNLIRGMEVVARLLHIAKPHERKTFYLKEGELIACFGENYIIAGLLAKKTHLPMAVGWIRRLTNFLDKFGLMTIDEIEKRFIEFVLKS